MADEEAADKRHDPSEKKWKDAAERGQLPKSADINATAVLAAGAAALAFGSKPMVDAIRGYAGRLLDGSGPYTLTMPQAVELSHDALQTVGISLSLPLGAVALASVAANLAQTRGKTAPKALEPKWDKLNVFEGIKQQYMSWTPLVELAKGLGKLVILGAVTAGAVYSWLDDMPSLAALHPAQLLEVIVELGWLVVAWSLPVVMLIAIGDYSYSYYRTFEQLKRTDKEVKDEQKEQEGDPYMKQARRQRARQIALGSMLAAMRDADVVVTNPTHYAVALRYKRDHGDEAPVVVARGIDAVAMALRAEARKLDVPRVENRPLARALYARVKVGHPIPEDLFAPVARVLAIIYRRRSGV